MLAIGQDEPTTLERFKAAVGAVGRVTPFRRPDGKTNYQYRVDGTKRSLAVLDLLRPYLSEPKREQARRVIEGYEEYRKHVQPSGWRKGHKRSPETRAKLSAAMKAIRAKQRAEREAGNA